MTCTHDFVISGDRLRCRHCDASAPRREPKEHLEEARGRLLGVRCARCGELGGFPQGSFQGAVMHDGCAADMAIERMDG